MVPGPPGWTGGGGRALPVPAGKRWAQDASNEPSPPPSSWGSDRGAISCQALAEHQPAKSSSLRIPFPEHRLRAARIRAEGHQRSNERVMFSGPAPNSPEEGMVPVCRSRILAAAAILTPTSHCPSGERSPRMTWPPRVPRKQNPEGRDQDGLVLDHPASRGIVSLALGTPTGIGRSSLFKADQWDL